MRTLLFVGLLALCACDNSQERLEALRKAFPPGTECKMAVQSRQVITNGVPQEEKTGELPYCKYEDSRGFVEAWHTRPGVEAHLKAPVLKQSKNWRMEQENTDEPRAPTLRNNLLVRLITTFSVYDDSEARGCMNIAPRPGNTQFRMVTKGKRDVLCNHTFEFDKGEIEYWIKITDKTN
jgi:hypothetical protein